jgi:uncharacterized protein YukE
MSVNRGQLWVNPEGVTNLGNRYAEHAATYDAYLRQLHTLRTQYQDAWGDDDMGKEFSQKFLSGLHQLETLIGGVKGTLHYTATGLRAGGQAYREVDDDARTAGHKMAAQFNALTVPGGGSGPSSGGPSSGGPSSGGASSGTPSSGTPLEPRIPASGSGAVSPSLSTPLEPRLPATPVSGEPSPGNLLAATQPPTGALIPATPALSSHVEEPELRTALIGGEKVPDGFRLELLNPMPDGTTHIDANRYEAVAPVGYTAVTAADGTPLDPGGRHFFLVKDNPQVDPLAAGYRPMYIGFTAGGEARPIG